MTAATITTHFPPLRTDLQARLVDAYPEHVGRMGWARERIVEHQRAGLRALLRHAAEHSPFHARRLAGIDLDAVEPGDLSALPVMTKAEMNAELDDVFTDRTLTRRGVEAALAAVGSEPAVLPGGHLAFASGGSSGERGIFVLERAGMVQFLGSVTRGLVARIGAMGGPPPGGLTVAIVGAASAVHLTGAVPAMAAGGVLPFHYLGAPVTLPLPEIVGRLNALAPPVLYGYPSMIARLAAERVAGRLRIAPMIVTCTSETLTPELRAAIRAGFGVPVVDAYATTEGLVGSAPPDDDVVVLAEDGAVVELVDERDRPVPPGTPSAKVLVTVLGNRVQPLIRYAITDSMVEQAPAAGHGHRRVRVQGRSDDVFRYGHPGGDVVVHPLVVRSVLVHAADVLEYQVRQTCNGVDVVAVAEPGLDSDGLRARLVVALADAGLDRPQVTVRVVPGLERHPETGKLRRFVPLP